MTHYTLRIRQAVPALGLEPDDLLLIDLDARRLVFQRQLVLDDAAPAVLAGLKQYDLEPLGKDRWEQLGRLLDAFGELAAAQRTDRKAAEAALATLVTPGVALPEEPGVETFPMAPAARVRLRRVLDRLRSSRRRRRER